MTLRPPAVIIGARKGTEAERSLEVVRAFIGRKQIDFTRSAIAYCYPIGTLAVVGGIWFEVKQKPFAECSMPYPLPIECPDSRDIIR